MFVWPLLTQVPDYNETVFSIKYHWLFPDKSTLYHYIRVKLIYLKSGRPFVPYFWEWVFPVLVNYLKYKKNRCIHVGIYVCMYVCMYTLA